MKPPARTRTVIVNDSPTTRASLRSAVAMAGGMDVVAEAADGVEAVSVVVRTKPDIVLMDVVMPRMDGYEATRQIMAKSPVAIVMVTAAVDPRDERVVFDALAAGALAIAAAPPAPNHPQYGQRCAALGQLLRTMSTVHVGAVSRALASKVQEPARLPPVANDRVRAIGIVTSTGGPQALLEVLSSLAQRGTTMPPIVIVQHMASGFTEGFVHWIRGRSGYDVVVAEAGMPIQSGRAYMAPEDVHLGVQDGPGGGLVAHLLDAPPIARFRPSGTFLLRSLAAACGASSLAVVMTGMGEDGAQGALEVRRAGGVVVAQDEATSVVYGMPRAVVELGAATTVLALGDVAAYLVRGSQA